jgi:hypothetical protein
MGNKEPDRRRRRKRKLFDLHYPEGVTHDQQGLPILDHETEAEVEDELPRLSLTQQMRDGLVEEIVADAPGVLVNLPDQCTSSIIVKAHVLTREQIVELVRVLKPPGTVTFAF